MKRENLQPEEAAQATRAKAVKRHYLSAVDGESGGEPETHEGGNLSRIFTFLLLLHVFLIGAVVLYNVIVKKPGGTQVAEVPAAAETAKEPAPVKGNDESSKTASSENTAGETQPQATKMIEYVVTPGENLQSIADSSGVSIELLKSINKLNAAGDIYVGRKLLIPQGAAPEVSALETLRVRSAVGNSENPLAQPAQKRPDAAPPAVKQEAPVPVAKPVAPASAKLDEPAKPAPAKTAVSAREHEVQSGETFYAIARKYGVNVDDLMKANGFTDPGKLRKGTVLKVPAK